MAELSQNFPEGIDYKIVYDTTAFVQRVHPGSREDPVRGGRAGRHRGAGVPADLAGIRSFRWWPCRWPSSAPSPSCSRSGSPSTSSRSSAWCWPSASWWTTPSWWWRTSSATSSRAWRPGEAAHKAMDEVTGPVIAIALVLCAVFVPVALIAGITGQFFRQFALTIAVSTVISAFNSLTLSPALCRDPASAARRAARPADPGPRPAPRLARSGPSTAASGRARSSYGLGVERLATRPALRRSLRLRRAAGLTVLVFRLVPAGFMPQQDKALSGRRGQLPDAASLDRTDAVMVRMAKIALQTPGVAHSVRFAGSVGATASSTPQRRASSSSCSSRSRSGPTPSCRARRWPRR